MASRDSAIPEDFVRHLCKAIPGFKAETGRHQIGMAWMLWTGTNKRRRHSRYEGFAMFTFEELDDAFGRRKFGEVNARLNLFEVSPWSQEMHTTKGYKATTMASASRDKYLEKDWRATTRLLYGDSQVLRSLPAAVASKGMDGITTTAWRNAKNLNQVRVDVDALRKLRKILRDRRDMGQQGLTPASLVAVGDVEKRSDRMLTVISQILRMAKTDVAGNGYVSHRYVQSASGRLYAKNINLQTVPKPIKQAALNGLWEYDFANCHYSILMQMAALHGHQCVAIADYLTNKKATRLAIATAAGITEDQAKLVLLAILYGATQSEWEESAIPEAVGIDCAKLLYANEQFQAIRDDIGKARAKILKGWKRTANGRLTNAFGKAIGNRQDGRQKLAHLIQGVEAKALQAALDLYPNDIVLIQHDGFAATGKLDARKIEAAVLEATGYQLKLEEELIQINLDEWIGRPHTPKRKRRPQKPKRKRA